MSSKLSYYSVQHVNFVHNKATDEVEARIKLLHKPLSNPVATGIHCTFDEFKSYKEHNRTPADKRLSQELILWERSILSAARHLGEANQPATVGRILEARHLIPADMKNCLVLGVQFGFAKFHREGDSYGQVTAKICVDATITKAFMPTGIKCLKEDWQDWQCYRSTVSTRRLVDSLNQWQQKVIDAANSLKEQGESLSPDAVYQVAMGRPVRVNGQLV